MLLKPLPNIIGGYLLLGLIAVLVLFDDHEKLSSHLMVSFAITSSSKLRLLTGESRRTVALTLYLPQRLLQAFYPLVDLLGRDVKGWHEPNGVGLDPVEQQPSLVGVGQNLT